MSQYEPGTNEAEQEGADMDAIAERAAAMDAFPEAEDYDPEANYETTITAGMAEQTWDEFGLASIPILADNGDTERRLILRNGRVIADVSSEYKLLPNEVLAVVADEIANELDLVPWSQFDGDWFIKLDEHIIMDQDGRRMHALYAQNEPVQITDENGDEDEIHIGVAVHNSIDGSLGFNVGLFTFRHACRNMVWMGVNGEGMDFDDREVIAHGSHKHTKGLVVNPDDLYDEIRNTLFFADEVSEAYEAWRDQYLTVEHVKDLLDCGLPDSDLPDWISDYEKNKADDENDLKDALERAREAAKENEDLTGEGTEELPEEAVDSIIRANMPAQATVWDTYNDVTESVWHSDSTSDQSKQRKFKQLHKALEPSTSEDVQVR